MLLLRPIQHKINRNESPRFEDLMQKSIEHCIRDLISSKSLYQNANFALSDLRGHLSPLVLHPHTETGLNLEMNLRPLNMIIEESQTIPSIQAGSGASQIPINFFAVACTLWCQTCNHDTTFKAIAGKAEQGFIPYPRQLTDKTEQTFLMIYRCEHCKKTIHSCLLHRFGTKLQLCGFAPRKPTRPDKSLPKDLQPIYSDAINAVAESDLFAGFYHLRTLLEFYLKSKLNVPITDKRRGEELVGDYQKTITDCPFVPALKPVYESLSQFMHSRTGTAEDFSDQSTQILDHIRGVSEVRRLTALYTAPRQ